jgi:hypothetical protein
MLFSWVKPSENFTKSPTFTDYLQTIDPSGRGCAGGQPENPNDIGCICGADNKTDNLAFRKLYHITDFHLRPPNHQQGENRIAYD